MYIISQIVEVVVLAITLISYQLKKKENIFKGMVMANIFDILHYVCLGAYSGCATKVIALFRNIFILVKEKNEKLNSLVFLFLFIFLYVIVMFITYDNLLSLFPFLAAIIYMVVVWNGDEVSVKRIAFICYFLWLIYNISIFSIVGVIANIISLIFTYIAYYNTRKEIIK